eukprot:gene4589-5728_t
MSHHTNYTLAALTLGGGIIGYVKGKSLPSLIAGTTFAVLYTGLGELIKTEPQLGHGLTAALSLVLAGTMGRRALKTKKMMPAGAVSVLGAVAGAYHCKKYYDFVNGV